MASPIRVLPIRIRAVGVVAVGASGRNRHSRSLSSCSALAIASTSRRRSRSSIDSLSPIRPRSITVWRIVLRSLSACLATAGASS
ncbi:Uncharacterised protein [Mycobacterium tuberculosis]|nr:Uncharacterised protein [Mycobacterium tuberculosis]